MRRDRTGELVDEDQDHGHAAAVIPLPHRCDGGWLDYDADHPRPCLTCRPYLARTRPALEPPDLDRITAGVQLVRDTLARRVHNGPEARP